MNEYQCQKCGEKWYSAADLAILLNAYCKKCGGELRDAKTIKCDDEDE